MGFFRSLFILQSWIANSGGSRGFNPRITPAESMSALHAAEIPEVLKGHGFSRAAKTNRMSGALAPEGQLLHLIWAFSAAFLYDSRRSRIPDGAGGFNPRNNGEFRRPLGPGHLFVSQNRAKYNCSIQPWGVADSARP